MKHLILLFLILQSATSFGQKHYTFDYAIETEYRSFSKDSIKKRIIYLTNSKDNSYFVELTEKDSLHYQMVFLEHDKLRAEVMVSKKELKSSEFINIDCKSVNLYKNIYKDATKRYDFLKLEDTLLNNTKHQAYKLYCNLELKKRIKRGAGTNVYIVDSETSFHLPLLTHPTAYEEWKLHKNIPNGLFLEKTFISVFDEVGGIETRINYVEIDKSVVIEKGCNPGHISIKVR